MAAFGPFIREHDDRVTDLDLRMPDLAAMLEPQDLGCGERLLVPVDCVRRVLDGEVGRDAVIAFRNGFGHCRAPCSNPPGRARLLPLPESPQTRSSRPSRRPARRLRAPPWKSWTRPPPSPRK